MRLSNTELVSLFGRNYVVSLSPQEYEMHLLHGLDIYSDRSKPKKVEYKRPISKKKTSKSKKVNVNALTNALKLVSVNSDVNKLVRRLTNVRLGTRR